MEGATDESEIERRIIEIIAYNGGVRADRIDRTTTLVADLHMDGLDVDDIVFSVAKEFDIDMSGYLWDRYHGPEAAGCLVFWVGRPSSEWIPIRVQDLIESAQQKKWTL